MIAQSRFLKLGGVCVITTTFCVSLFVPLAPVSAFGMSPPEIPVNILRNTTQRKFVTLYRSPEDKGDVHIEASTEGPNGDFIKLTDTTFIIPDGQMEYKYYFDVNPGNAANGHYDAKLTLLKVPDAINLPPGAGSVIKTGVAVKVPVTIDGSEIVDFRLVRVRAADTEVDQNVEVHYMITNNGNVNWRPDKIKFTFIDAFDQTVVATSEVSGDAIPLINAGTENTEVYVQVAPKLPEGTYIVSAEFFVKDKSVGVLNSQNTFSVLPPGTLKQTAQINTIVVNKEVYKPGEKIKLDTEFENTGELPVTAIFFASVSRNGEFVDLVRGQEYEVASHEKVAMTQVLDYTKPGKYSVDTYVEFGKKKTDVKNVQFTIRRFDIPSALTAIAIGGGVIALLGGSAIYMLRRKKLASMALKSKTRVAKK